MGEIPGGPLEIRVQEIIGHPFDPFDDERTRTVTPEQRAHLEEFLYQKYIQRIKPENLPSGSLVISEEGVAYNMGVIVNELLEDPIEDAAIFYAKFMQH